MRTDQTVEVGDTVVTSGLGGVFPKGLPLGTVLSVERTSGSLYYEIEVEPLASAESFEEVLVITSLTEDQKATSEDVAEADLQDTAPSAAANAEASSEGEQNADEQEDVSEDTEYYEESSEEG